MLRLIEAFAGVGVLISSVEAIYRQTRGSKPALTTWDVMKSRHPVLVVGRWARVYDVVANDRSVRVVHVLGALSATVLVTGSGPSPVRGICGLVAAASIIVSAIHSPYGLDGADQVMILVLVAAGLGRFGNARAHDVAILFIALQVALSYFIAGLAKAKSQDWRAGTALPGLFSTSIYGSPLMSRLLRASPRASKATSVFIMSWELLFPLALLAPVKVCATILLVGLVFHASCAVLMHLNTFLWAFAATYPAVWFVNANVHV